MGRREKLRSRDLKRISEHLLTSSCVKVFCKGARLSESERVRHCDLTFQFLAVLLTRASFPQANLHGVTQCS